MQCSSWRIWRIRLCIQNLVFFFFLVSLIGLNLVFWCFCFGLVFALYVLLTIHQIPPFGLGKEKQQQKKNWVLTCNEDQSSLYVDVFLGTRLSILQWQSQKNRIPLHSIPEKIWFTVHKGSYCTLSSILICKAFLLFDQVSLFKVMVHNYM